MKMQSAFTISLMFHLLIFMAFSLGFLSSTRTYKAGIADAKIVRAYSATVTQLHFQSRQHKQIKLTAKANTITVRRKFANVSGKKRSIATKGKPISGLIALLHAVIQGHQVYPPSAMEMERQGRVTVSFRLSPDGLVSNIHVLKSSGTASLDRAGVDAVRRAAPIKGVHEYIHQPRAFAIDVVFQLS